MAVAIVPARADERRLRPDARQKFGADGIFAAVMGDDQNIRQKRVVGKLFQNVRRRVAGKQNRLMPKREFSKRASRRFPPLRCHAGAGLHRSETNLPVPFGEQISDSFSVSAVSSPQTTVSICRFSPIASASFAWSPSLCDRIIASIRPAPQRRSAPVSSLLPKRRRRRPFRSRRGCSSPPS